jgi:hypothetical protein
MPTLATKAAPLSPSEVLPTSVVHTDRPRNRRSVRGVSDVSCAQTSGAPGVGGPCVSAVGGSEDLRLYTSANDGERLGVGIVVDDVSGKRGAQGLRNNSHVVVSEATDVTHAERGKSC